MKQEVKISYAQNREDIILEALVGDRRAGFYVDIGANDPHKDSVTKRFYLKGWHGLNIEPNKLLWERLEFDRPRDVNLQIGAGDQNGKKIYREYPGGNGLSTFSEDMKLENEQAYTGDYNDYEVEVKKLTTVFSEQHVESIDFMKIDVEGYEWEVIKGNDWDIYRPSVLCIEANHTTRLQKWHSFFDENEYEFVFFDGINEYYRDKRKGPWPEFLYPEAILALPVVTYTQYQEQSVLKTKISGLNKELDFTRIHIRYLWKEAEARQSQIQALQNEIAQMRRLRVALKTFIKSINNAVNQRIEALNRPSVKIRSFPPESIIPVEGSYTPGTLLKKIRLFDYENSYKRTILIPAPHAIYYRVVKKTYQTVKKIVKLVVRGIEKVRKAV